MADTAPEQDTPAGVDPATVDDSAEAGDKPTIRVAGLLVHEGSILMVEQGRGDERYWLLPGGGVQFGETLSDALRRELQEELGLRVGVQRLVAIVESISPEPDYAKHVIHLVFQISAPAEALPEPQDVKVLNARFLSEFQLQSADVRPPITDFLGACVREMPSSPQYLGRRW
jgi:8-oxo-dGTP diphosphatase